MKYIAYCRKSSEEKDRQVLSIPAQISDLQEFAKREKIEIVEFVQEEKTAKVPGRELFEGMLRKIEKGFATGIVSWHPDRLARNSIDGGKIIYLLDLGKLIDIKFPQYWFENTPQGKFMLSIAFSQSKYYVDNLSENVKRGNRHKLRNGIWPSKAPLGYINEPKLRTIEVNREKSKIIKKGFEMFLQGKSAMEINNFFHKHGITRNDGRPLHLTSVRNILTNKFYIGILKYAGEYYEASHECFVPKDIFQKVQEIMKQRNKPQNKKEGFAFLGLTKCGECDASITAEQKFKYYPKTRGKVRYVYYRCTKKLKPCTQKYLNEPEFEKQLRKIVSGVSLPQEWADDWYKWMERDEVLEKESAKTNVAKLEQEMKTLDEKLNKLLDVYLEGVIESEIYKQKKNEIFEEKLRLQEEIAKIEETGSAWLGLMREFVDSALQGQKIARAKKNNEELAFFAKTVGSNYFLLNRRLVPKYKLGFQTLFSELGGCGRPSHLNSSSIRVGRDGIGPSTSSLSVKRSTGELPTQDLF